MEKQFLVYKSSAGSGKTFTLVKEFLKLCFEAVDHKYFSKILAITFTNKATQEMKSRIIEDLQKLADLSEESGMRELLVEELEKTKEELAEKAEKILAAILHNYGDFSVSTIDSFSYRLVKTFAKDLEIPMNFQLEIDAKRILEESVNALIESVGVDEKLTKHLIDFVLFRVEEEGSWRIESDLENFAKNLTADNNSSYLKSLKKNSSQDFENLRKKLSQIINQTEQEFEKLKQKGIDLIEKNNIDIASFYRGSSGIGKYVYKIDITDPASFEMNSYVRTTIEEDKWYAGKATTSDKAAIDSIKNDMLKHIEEVQLFFNERIALYISCITVQNNLYSLSLIKDIDGRIEAYKKEERILPIADFNKKIAQFVLEEPVPFIYHRLGERYKHLMVDEFQDTSVLQFINLLPLIENSLSEGKKNMLVGDAKQAIYRWRGGEVRQLAEMPDYVDNSFKDNVFVQDRMQVLRSQYNGVPLDTNYRSKQTIIDFNNAFFGYLRDQNDLIFDSVKNVFKEVEQKVKKSNENQGMVEITFLDNGQQEFQLKRTLEVIEESLAAQYTLSDIAVLCRTNAQAVAVANHLKDNNIAVISSEALLIKSSPKVRFLVNFIIWMNNNQDAKARKDIVSYLVEKEGLKPEIDSYLKQYVKEDKFHKTKDIRELFVTLNYKIDTSVLQLKPLHLLFEELIRIFRMDDTFDIYVQSFQEEVLSFSQKEGNNINMFIEWWSEFQDKLALDIPKSTDAVEVLTIHKAKGLAYPVVIVPFIKRDTKSNPNDIWVNLPEEIVEETKVSYALIRENKALEQSAFRDAYQEEIQAQQMDRLNTLYVALTRAEDRMYIITEPPTKDLNTASEANLLKSFVKHNNIELIEGDEADIYRWGTVIEKEIKPIEEQEETIELDYLSLAWEDKLSISKEGRKNWLIETENEQRDYGNLMHDILADIKTIDDVETVLNRKYFKGEIEESEREFLNQKLTEIISHKELKGFFSEEVEIKREAALITAAGKILRPDRLVMFNDKWVVIDYKTGEKNESHEEQIREYIHALSKMTTLKVEGLIIYTSNLELLAVA